MSDIPEPHSHPFSYKSAEEFLLKEAHEFKLFRELLKTMPETLLPKDPHEYATKINVLALFWASTKVAIGQKP